VAVANAPAPAINILRRKFEGAFAFIAEVIFVPYAKVAVAKTASLKAYETTHKPSRRIFGDRPVNS
jgi:hypothetical protein